VKTTEEYLPHLQKFMQAVALKYYLNIWDKNAVSEMLLLFTNIPNKWPPWWNGKISERNGGDNS
jgi:hypothetical protein